MKKWLKRIRGALGMGLSWAAAWAGVGTILMLLWGLLGGASFTLGVVLDLVFFAGFFALGGLIAGAGSALRRDLREHSFNLAAVL